ncbi:MAG: hypothetical protein AAGD32_06200 [Planctomycetota bacterium]
MIRQNRHVPQRRSEPDDLADHVRLTIRPDPSYTGNTPAAIRLRQVLKRLLRTYGYRCTSAEPIDPPTDNEPGGGRD